MNILVLDDEREIADLVEVYLKNENYNVFKFYDAKEAINCIESQKLDFAILDVMIKDVDGFKICKMIRDKGLNFPVIMLTAKIEDKDKINKINYKFDSGIKFEGYESADDLLDEFNSNGIKTEEINF